MICGDGIGGDGAVTGGGDDEIGIKIDFLIIIIIRFGGKGGSEDSKSRV